MSRPIFDVFENVPQWAVCYLVNADDSGLSESDKRLVDVWYDDMIKNGMRPIAPIDGTENEFCAHPAFGLACNTVDFSIELIGGKDDNILN